MTEREAIVAELERELEHCPATPAGYREAVYLRHRLSLWRGDHLAPETQEDQAND